MENEIDGDRLANAQKAADAEFADQGMAAYVASWNGLTKDQKALLRLAAEAEAARVLREAEERAAAEKREAACSRR